MASLKEVKTRIISVENTKKITVARQMISSARLRQSQGVLEKVKRYQKEITSMIANLNNPQTPFAHPLTTPHDKGAVAIVIMSSNSGMCGSFNARMIKELNNLPATYPNEPLLFFPIGKKIREAAAHLGYSIHGHFDELAAKNSFALNADLVEQLITLFRAQTVKKVELVYYHYKNAMNQEIIYEQLLPYILPGQSASTAGSDPDLPIFEPSRPAILSAVLPQAIKSQFYLALADNQTAEHGARTLAMQLASENANDLLDELRLSYNKLRQQNITSQLLDIVGGTFA